MLSGGPSLAADIAGPARVIDGDTLDIAGTRIRLAGLDAPETDQTCETEHGIPWACGQWVTTELRAVLTGHIVTCQDLGEGGYGRTLGRCMWDGRDLSAWLVAQGYAWVDPRFEQTYAALQRQAAAGARGLWSQSAKAPWDHRVTRVVGRQAPSQDCVIKGNISSSGERIYHVPGQQHYDRTGIRTDRGEAWFCTTQQAERAGWRAARR